MIDFTELIFLQTYKRRGSVFFNIFFTKFFYHRGGILAWNPFYQFRKDSVVFLPLYLILWIFLILQEYYQNFLKEGNFWKSEFIQGFLRELIQRFSQKEYFFHRYSEILIAIYFNFSRVFLYKFRKFSRNSFMYYSISICSDLSSGTHSEILTVMIQEFLQRGTDQFQ